MAKRNYGIDYVILGIILLGILAYDFHQYQKMMLVLEENCVSVAERILWDDECIELSKAIDNIVLEMIALGVGAAIMVLIGINKMRNSETYFDEDEEDSGWPWWVIIVVPIGLAVVGTAIMIITEG
tara:strand:- start:58 stop:435 length:378 start_codon:yes stop_codon:yes gene_type:complete